MHVSYERDKIIFSPHDSKEFEEQINNIREIVNILQKQADVLQSALYALEDCRFKFSITLSANPVEVPEVRGLKEIIEENKIKSDIAQD